MNNYKSDVVRQGNSLLLGSKFSKKIILFGVMTVIAVSSVLTSCKKEGTETVSPELKLNSEKALAPTAGGSALNLTNATGTVELSSSGNIYTVKNYFVSQGIYDSVGNHIPNGTYYFDFSDNDNKKGATKTTPPSNNVWDISFSSTGNAYINRNTNSLQGSEVKYVDEAFSTVKGYAASVWNDGAKAKTIATFPFGYNRMVTSYDYSATGATTGWFNYYFTNHEVLATTNRTILVLDAAGDVYALHMINVYKNGAPYEPGDNTANPPADYSWLKFEYKKLGAL